LGTRGGAAVALSGQGASIVPKDARRVTGCTVPRITPRLPAAVHRSTIWLADAVGVVMRGGIFPVTHITSLWSRPRHDVLYGHP